VSRVGVAMTSLGLVLACAAPVPASPKVFDVQIDARASSFSLAASVFFPREIPVHAGDTVRFTAVDRGEIHTVTFGTLVDAALDRLAKVPPGAPRPTLESFGLPPVLIGEPATSLGRTATLPCFVESGPAPGPDGCRPEQQAQPDLTGRQTLFNSGYLAGGDVFAVRLGASTRPGTYGFICLLHGPEMSGRIVVAENSRPGAAPRSSASSFGGWSRSSRGSRGTCLLPPSSRAYLRLASRTRRRRCSGLPRSPCDAANR